MSSTKARAAKLKKQTKNPKPCIDGFDDMNSAVKLGKIETIKKFLERGDRADEARTGGDNNTPIHVAAFEKFPDKLQLLYESLPEKDRLAAINKPNLNGVTSLHEACLISKEATPEAIENMPKTIEYLLKNGADTTKKAFVNGQKEYHGKILCCTPLVALKEQMLDYPKDSMEYKTLNQCTNIMQEHTAKQKINTPSKPRI